MWLALSVSLAAARMPCGTEEALRHAPPPARAPRAAAPPSEPAHRDPYGVENVRTSANFAVRWGPDYIPEEQVTQLLNAMEIAWSVQVTNMGHPRPLGTDQWYFNVYIGNTGGGAPSIGDFGGFQTFDSDGYPMIVMNPLTLDDEDGAEATAIHEFYHAIQSSLGRYPYAGLGAWYWEATAEWAAASTRPTNPAVGSSAYGYALLPDLPVNFFDYPDSNALQESHQYGAFLFPWYLSGLFGPELIRDTWVIPGSSDDPLEVLREQLALRGEDFDAVWLDHIATLAAWDFPMADLWHDEVTYLANYVGSRQYAGVFSTDGRHEPLRREGWGEAPGRYGFNVFVLQDPRFGDVDIEVTGDALGDAGSPATFVARVVHIDGYDARYTPLVFDGATARATVPVDGADQVLLVVGALTPATTHWDSETFAFTMTMSIGEPPDPGSGGLSIETPKPTEPVPSVCATGAETWSPLTLAVLLALRRRSRAPNRV